MITVTAIDLKNQANTDWQTKFTVSKGMSLKTFVISRSICCKFLGFFHTQCLPYFK